MAKTIQLLTARCGKIRPDSVADYLAHDRFSALKKAMNMSPMEIINEVIAECQEQGLIDQWVEEYSAICVEQNQI